MEENERPTDANAQGQPGKGPPAAADRPPPGQRPAGSTSDQVLDQLRGLRRSTDDKVIAGVAGGVGRSLGIDPLLLRVVLAVLVLFGGTGIVLYALGWLLMPQDDGTALGGAAGAGPSAVPPVRLDGVARRHPGRSPSRSAWSAPSRSGTDRSCSRWPSSRLLVLLLRQDNQAPRDRGRPAPAPHRHRRPPRHRVATPRPACPRPRTAYVAPRRRTPAPDHGCAGRYRRTGAPGAADVDRTGAAAATPAAAPAEAPLAPVRHHVQPGA